MQHVFGGRTRPCHPRRSASLLFCSLVAASASLNAAAQTRVEPVVLTASRVVEPLGGTLRDVSVIDGANLRDAGVVDLVDALRLLPGVEISSVGPGSTPSIFLRGANSNQTLVLVDGQRVGSSYSGLSGLQLINVDQIDRIEVLRGAAASLYGADAVGGVIQIFTRRDRSASLRASTGEWRSHQLSVTAGLGDSANGLNVSVAQNASRGYNAIVNPADYSYNPDRDGYRSTSVHVAGNIALTPTLAVSATAYEAQGLAQYDGDSTHDDRIKSVVRNTGVTIEYQASPAWKSTWRAGTATDESEFISNYPGAYRTQNDQLSWQNAVRINSALNLLGALEWRRESVAGTDALPVTSRRTNSALLGADWQVDAARFNTSARLDHSDQFGARSTVNASFGYRLSSSLRATFNAGNSFKAPTFNDLYYPGYANPSLKPERGQTVDAALHWSSTGSKFSATVYQNHITDLIQFMCDESYHCAPQNVSRARLQGLTLAGSTQYRGLLIDASADFGKPIDTTTDTVLPRRARAHGTLKLSGDVMGVSTGIEVVASGRRYDDSANQRALPGYAVITAYASKAIGARARIGVRIENATDRDYQLAYGYATGGRRAWLTLAVVH